MPNRYFHVTEFTEIPILDALFSSLSLSVASSGETLSSAPPATSVAATSWRISARLDLRRRLQLLQTIVCLLGAHPACGGSMIGASFQFIFFSMLGYRKCRVEACLRTLSGAADASPRGWDFSP